MSEISYVDNANPAYIEELYQKYESNPQDVDPYWQKFFEGFDFAAQSSTPLSSMSNKEVAVTKLIQGYRSRGHLIAKTNPIRERRQHKSDLELNYFGLDESDLKSKFSAGHEIKIGEATLEQILSHLHQTYCSSIGVEFMYCRNEKLRQFLYNEMETCGNLGNFSIDQKKHILKKINQAVTFESFLQTKYVGKKRFSLEGNESLIPALDTAIAEAAKQGTKEVVLGMAHRGRLNVLVNIFEKSYETVFSEFEDSSIPKEYERGGDVKYHLGKSADIKTQDGNDVHLSLVFNPSHLEAVNPVLQGIVYAKAMDEFNEDTQAILPIVIHGDSAISGQGVNYEVANISRLDGFATGGTIHIVVNNQVGFTANYKESRSSVYCTDLAKVTESPVFHVNADDPEAVVYAMTLAIKIRQKFGIDVYIDILGYRRYGHNEGDEPRFTQPILYKSIQSHQNVYKQYLSQLVSRGDISEVDASNEEKSFKQTLQEKLDSAKKSPALSSEVFQRKWKGYRLAKLKDFDKSIKTGVKSADLTKVSKALTTPPPVELFNKMKKLIDQRSQLIKNKEVDWALAELLAFGSLLNEGHPVRITGQDSQRGTFSHRHAVIKDFENESHYIPLNNISKNQAKLQVYNSLLSEYCCMGFEFGYSLASPQSLVIWEAQFGDFANGAQIVIDQFVSSSEHKWQRMSGLVLLLPHGYEGQGPEHSSARLERFLQLCAEQNMVVANITSPANMFHVLRRQVKNDYRKPLVIMSPKSLFRHHLVKSSIDELTSGEFQEIIDDKEVTAKSVKRVVLCSGKLYYDLFESRNQTSSKDVALVRIEQLYPLSKPQLDKLKKKYSHVTDWVWAQEEPSNMGAWFYILHHLRDWNLTLKSRPESASPATGSTKAHLKSQQDLIDDILTI